MRFRKALGDALREQDLERLLEILLEHLEGTLQMNFAFGVVCKVTNSFAKSKNSPTLRDFAFRLGKPKVWTPPSNFFSPIAPPRFFPSRHFDVRRACQSPARPGRRQLPPSPGLRTSRRPAQAAFVVCRRRRSRQFGSVHLRPPSREGPLPFPRRGRVCPPDVAAYVVVRGRVRVSVGARGREGGRARQGGRTDVEKSRGVGSRGDGVRRGRPKL